MNSYPKNGHQKKLSEPDSPNPKKGTAQSYKGETVKGPNAQYKEELVQPNSSNMYPGSNERSAKTGGNMKAPHVSGAKGDCLVKSSAELSTGPNPQFLGDGGTSAPSASNPVRKGRWGNKDTRGKADLDLNAL